jgi:hypothetical protein
VSIETWTNLILPRLSGAMKPVLEAEITQTVKNFCRESTAWRDVIYALDIQADQREVQLQWGDGTQGKVLGALRLYSGGRQITPFSHAPWESRTTLPAGWTSSPSDPSVIVLATIPSEDWQAQLDAYVYLEPVNPSEYVPPVLLDSFWEIIFDGAVGRMYGQPNKPYSDPTLAQYHLRRYRNGTVIARDKATRGFTGNAQNWTFPPFGV